VPVQPLPHHCQIGHRWRSLWVCNMRRAIMRHEAGDLAESVFRSAVLHASF